MSNLHREQSSGSEFASVASLCVLLLLPFGFAARAQSPQATEIKRHHYPINLKLDFDALSYSGSERVLWVNQGEHATAVLYFHLYSNLRPDPAVGAGPQAAE